MKNKIEIMIKEFDIVKYGKDLQVKKRYSVTSDDIQFIKENKSEFIMAIENMEISKKIEREERIKKINEIQGLKELEEAIAEWNNYHYKMEKRFDNEYMSSLPVNKPTSNIDEIKNKYPRANAYLIAKSWANSNNYTKSDAGKKALERIISNENHEIVLKQMNDEWSKYTTEKIWD